MSKKKPSYNDMASSCVQDEQPPRSTSGGCEAYGCPMPGSISGSIRGGGPWLCRHHFGAESSEWQLITERLRAEARHAEFA